MTPAALALPAHVTQHRYATASEAASALAELAARTLTTAIDARGSAHLYVSGGRSPVPFLEALSRQPLAWQHVTVGLVDERCVPADDDASNARLVRTHLLQNAAHAALFEPLYESGLDAETAAQRADTRLAIGPRPDLVVLGMGDDGHTASLFPGAPGTAAGLDPRGTRSVVATHPQTVPHARLSLTLPALRRARTLALAIQGEVKRHRLESAVGAAPETLPIAAMLDADLPLQLFFNP
ncbi:6-phosphogluconolactonase [Solimonas marina]|uniref:6-phosphogluconolactonase n=1 Tax=Solimonas marina TaxID=2714601 RepID=A0A969WCM6_9GAMM|nr:6-phosphogluconolactonase [Solimonas marina]NKF24089.1 6-phosphogluconolactonase [Solimonas marina]